jgi:hypothetical protein
MPLVLDVSDILDKPTAWSFIPPGRTNGGNISGGSNITTQQLSPLRIPQSPAPSTFSEHDPIELIVSYAAMPPSPTAVAFSEVGSNSADDEPGKANATTTTTTTRTRRL